MKTPINNDRLHTAKQNLKSLKQIGKRTNNKKLSVLTAITKAALNCLLTFPTRETFTDASAELDMEWTYIQSYSTLTHFLQKNPDIIPIKEYRYLASRNPFYFLEKT